MAYLLVCVRTEDKIFDRAVFSKDLAPIKFDSSEMGLALRHDPCTNSAQYFVLHSHAKPRRLSNAGNSGKEVGYRNQTEAGTSQSSSSRPGTSQESSSKPGSSEAKTGSSPTCSCSKDGKSDNSCKSCDKSIAPKFSLVLLDVEYKIVTKLKSNVAYHSFKEMSRSKAFREGFVNFIRRKNRLRDVRRKVCTCESVYNACNLSIHLPRLLEVCLEPAPADVCYAWNEKLRCLVQKRKIMEETMAWLSTLGGGYSSLGDTFEHFSEEAGKISISQLHIAMEMGDPILASKCRLFYALSLMQRGPLSHSKKLIRDEYHFAIQLKVQDQRLIDMCRGMWNKLRYLYSRRHRQRLNSISCEEPITITTDHHSNQDHSILHDEGNTSTTITGHHGNLVNSILHDEEETHILTQGYIEKLDTTLSDTLHSIKEKLSTTSLTNYHGNKEACIFTDMETAL